MTVYVDIMLDGYFYRQVRYTESCMQVMSDGGYEPLADKNRIKQFVLDKFPFLRGRNYSISTTKNRRANF